MGKNNPILNVAVGIPAYNEEKNIASVIIKLKEITNTIIVCDDGSKDLTSQIAKGLGANLVNHSKNLGYGAAIRSIFLKAKELEVDVLVTFDADGQHRVEDIKKVLEPIMENRADIVIGSRFLGGDENVPKYRKIGIKTITKITNTTTGSKITDSQSGFRAYNKTVLKEILPSEHGMGVSTEILIKASKHEYRITEVPIIILYKGKTSTHHAVPHGASVVLSTLKFTSIEHPLKFYGIPGLLLVGIGLFFILWTLQIFSETRTIITNVSLIAVGTTLLGTVLLMTALILYSIVSVVRERAEKL